MPTRSCVTPLHHVGQREHKSSDRDSYHRPSRRPSGRVLPNASGEALTKFTAMLTFVSSSPGFYQSPTTYTASATAITPLGEVQEYQLGDMMRRTYALSSNTATYIAGLSETELIATQLNSTADGGGEGGVIFDSAIAFCK